MASFRLAVGSLAVVTAAACAGTPESASSSAPDRADPPDEGTVTVRFVTYGDIDPDDEVPFGKIPYVQIAIIREKDVIVKEGDIGQYESRYESTNHLLDWWETVGGHDLGIKEHIPPGVRVQSTPEQLAAAPARFVTTGPDGTFEMSIAYNLDQSDDYSGIDYAFCAMSPVVDSLIAGCNYQNISLWRYIRSGDAMTIYVYFAHGYAIVEDSFNASDRFQRFSDGVEASDEPAYLWVNATADGGDVAYKDELPPPPSPVWDARAAVIDSAHINDWWESISNDDANELDMLFGQLYVGSEVLEHDPVHVVTTGPDGLGIISLPPGDYLLCETTGVSIVAGCLYEDLVGGRDHVFEIGFAEGGPNHVNMSSEAEVENFLTKEEVKRLLAIYQDETSDG